MTGLFQNGLIWLGAGISLAEILTGTYFASLGFKQGMAAIILGHIIGGALMFACGVIGGLSRKSAMESVKDCYGNKGGMLFSILNVVQLAGWTAIMIYDGAIAAGGLMLPGYHWCWCAIIGILIVVWIYVGISHLTRINATAMTGLLLMTVVLCWRIARLGAPWTTGEDAMSFIQALELSAAMPLSWLPLIADYTREAKRPVAASAVSTVVYGLTSIWMYAIGMAAAAATGESDIANIILKTGLGAAGLLIIVFSTVTTTFLDAWSGGISAEAICAKCKGKTIAVILAVAGTIAAIVWPMDDITGFLYLIGSVFAPMAAVQITDFFLLKKCGQIKQINKDFYIKSLVAWAIGLIAYQILMRYDFCLGYTIPSMVVCCLARLALR